MQLNKGDIEVQEPESVKTENALTGQTSARENINDEAYIVTKNSLIIWSKQAQVPRHMSSSQASIFGCSYLSGELSGEETITSGALSSDELSRVEGDWEGEGDEVSITLFFPLSGLEGAASVLGLADDGAALSALRGAVGASTNHDSISES